MATSCALRSAFGARNAVLSLAPMSQSQIQARAVPPICAAPALIGKRSLPNSRATRSLSAKPAFGSSRQLLGARTLPAQIQASTSHQKAPGATGGALSSQAIFGLAPDTLQWIFTVASTALMFRLLPPVSHALLVPAVFLNLPARVVEVMKQEAGAWIAVALVVLRLFSSSQLPKYFDLPLAVLLSILIAPYELLRFRGTQGAGIVSLAIGIFIAYSHASANNGIDNTMRSDVLPTTFAIALILLIPAAFLFGAYA